MVIEKLESWLTITMGYKRGETCPTGHCKGRRIWPRRTTSMYMLRQGENVHSRRLVTVAIRIEIQLNWLWDLPRIGGAHF